MRIIHFYYQNVYFYDVHFEQGKINCTSYDILFKNELLYPYN